MTHRALSIVAFFISAAALAAAQDAAAEIRQLNNQAARLYAMEEFDSAERAYRAALAVRPQDPLAAAAIAGNLGALYKRLNRYFAAEQMYARALELRRKWLPPARPEIADSMNNLAEIYRLEGRYWEARNLTAAAVRALEYADPRSPDMPVFLNNWAGLEKDLHHPDAAEPLFLQAESLAEKYGGPASRPLAIVLNNFAQLLTDKLDFVGAERLYRRAAAIFENLGPDNTHELAVTLANLGRMHVALGRPQEAWQAESRALALLERQAHPDELLRAAILHNLGSVLAAEGNITDALDYFDQSLVVHERILGREHPLIAQVLLDYSAAMDRTGQKSQARKLRKRAGQLAARQRRDDLSRYTVDASAFVHRP